MFSTIVGEYTGWSTSISADTSGSISAGYAARSTARAGTLSTISPSFHVSSTAVRVPCASTKLAEP